MIIGFCLGVLLLITIFSVITGNVFTSYSDSMGVDSSVLVNGTGTDFVVPTQNITFQVDSLIGAMIMIVVLATLIAIIGLRVLASGLSETSVKTLRTSIAYAGLWGVLSVLSYGLIVSIQTFGFIIYVVLSLLFVIGVFIKLGDNG